MAAVTSSTAAASASTLAGGASATAAEQQDRFMKLLVAQLKNQDPLNPMDNAQMTSQIAQIETAGGIEKLNATVNSLLAAFGGLQAQAATGLAGRSVLVPGKSLQLRDGAATAGVELAGAADTVTVEILDAAGGVARTLALGPAQAGSRTFRWDGRLDDGSQAADGNWSFRVKAAAAGKAVQAGALMAASVQSVAPSSGGVQLDLGAAGVQPQAAVRAYL